MQRTALRLVPPPILFALPPVIGWLADRRFPLPLPRPLFHFVGALLLVLAGALAAAALGLFAQTRTTVVPHGRPAALVTTGPYRISRNPMYVALTLASLGASAVVGTLWALLLVPLPVFAIHTVVIPLEEETLSKVFGDEYEAYKSHVRRWF